MMAHQVPGSFFSFENNAIHFDDANKVAVQLANDVVTAAGFSPPILAALVFVETARSL